VCHIGLVRTTTMTRPVHGSLIEGPTGLAIKVPNAAAERD
jgi:hypothetical protein